MIKYHKQINCIPLYTLGIPKWEPSFLLDLWNPPIMPNWFKFIGGIGVLFHVVLIRKCSSLRFALDWIYRYCIRLYKYKCLRLLRLPIYRKKQTGVWGHITKVFAEWWVILFNLASESSWSAVHIHWISMDLLIFPSRPTRKPNGLVLTRGFTRQDTLLRRWAGACSKWKRDLGNHSWVGSSILECSKPWTTKT